MVPFHANSNEHNLFFQQSVQDFNVVTTCKFSICYDIILCFFYKGLISTNYKKIILKLFVLSIALARMGTSLFVREITLIKAL